MRFLEAKAAKAARGAPENKALPGPGENKDVIDFASDEAAEAAAAAGLNVADFAGVTPSGASGGYTKADVTAIAEKKAAE